MTALRQNMLSLDTEQLGREPASFGPLDPLFDLSERLIEGIGSRRIDETRHELKIEKGIDDLSLAGRRKPQSGLDVPPSELNDSFEHGREHARILRALENRMID